MKKTKFLFILVLVGVGIIHIHLSAKEEQSYFMLQNIELLTSSESGNNTDCQDVGSLDCPINGSKVKYISE